MILKIFDDYSNLKKGATLKYKDYYKVLIDEPFLNDQNQYTIVSKKIRKISNMEDSLIPKFYPQTLTLGESNSIYIAVKSFLEEIIKSNMETLITYSQLNALIKKHLISL